MGLTKKIHKNLYNGVSQQPDSIRHDNQCTEQINFLSDPITGLTKRPGTEYLCDWDEATYHLASDYTVRTYTPEKLFHHSIIRDGENRFLYTIDDLGKQRLTDMDTGIKVPIISQDVNLPVTGDEITGALLMLLKLSSQQTTLG